MRPWECPRCRKVNAPWINQCLCAPVEIAPTQNFGVNFKVPTVPVTLPPGQYGYGPVETSTGSWVLNISDK